MFSEIKQKLDINERVYILLAYEDEDIQVGLIEYKNGMYMTCLVPYTFLVDLEQLENDILEIEGYSVYEEMTLEMLISRIEDDYGLEADSNLVYVEDILSYTKTLEEGLVLIEL